MPKERKKVLCMDAQRHAEYYGMQRTFDELYAKSKAGETFIDLMELVLSPDNIMLAYRNIKANKGSYTAGTDRKTITDIGRLTPDEVTEKVRKIVTGSEHGYRPKPVRRKEIPKPNGKTRPLGIFASLPTQTYRITNLMGQTVFTGSLTAETQQIDVSALPQGMYFISVGDNTRKFVVK